MSSSPFVEAIAQEFEEDVNAIRIKKLLHFVCYGIWENNLSNLIEIQMSDLIVRLIDVHADIEELQSALDSIVCRINKSEEYTVIANTIISKLQPLYEADTRNTDNQNVEDNSQVPPVPYAWDPEDSSHQERFFEIRMKIMQQTNPLRAKILIFSTLYRRFYGHDKDWLVVREKSLDEMLRYLSSVCTTPQKLQEKLYNTAKNLENPQENMQAAKTIVQAMMPCYENVPQPQPTRIDSTEKTPQDRVVREQTESTLETAQESDNQVEGTLTSTKQQTIETAEKAAPQIETEPQNSPTAQKEESEDDGDDEISVLDEATVGMPMVEGKPSAPSPQVSQSQNHEEIESTQVFTSPQQTGGLVHQIADSLRDKLDLEAELQGKVEDYVRQVINDLETVLQDLERQLDRKLAQQSAEEQLFWKHKALQEFMVKVQNNTDRFLDILQNMKVADRQRLNLPERQEKKTTFNTQSTHLTSKTSSPATEKSKTPAKANRQKVIALAQQGNPKAIAALIGKFLTNKNINILVAVRSGCLHVILESTESWHPKQLVPGLRKYILELKLNHIELVKIHLREPGAKTAIWTKEFPYKTATSS
ncbi:hypothetical protein [Geitlerinema sp. PCC 9228]|uniref:hypothetical protein n=1 Tax=Geitlerinema sp. PCC 9228 TaxID=111611 RepID=UPI0008F9C11E|nr:hypothetical protein [Geitlerinema sp. PCC 9228]